MNLHTELSDLNQVFSGSNPSIGPETNPADNLIDRRQEDNFPQPQIASDCYADDQALTCFEAFDATPPAATVSMPPKQARAAHLLGKRAIRGLKRGKVVNLAPKSARRTGRARGLKPAKPARVARARAVHSHSSHGGARKAADDGGGSSGGGGSDDEPPRRRRKPTPKRRWPRQIEVGWCWRYQFPSHMGRKIAPGERNFASSAAWMVAVIGPKHDRQSGTARTVRAVSSGRITEVVLGERVETHANIPISFYRFKTGDAEGALMSRAERRRAGRHAARESSSPWSPPAPPHGGVVGTLEDGRAWSVRFPTTGEAEYFLTILGPPPASEERLQAALRVMAKGLRHD